MTFFELYIQFPFVSSGAGVIFNVKVDRELHGEVFPGNDDKSRLIIFGNSKVLAGFVPNEFDRLTSAEGIPLVSFNSGYPGNSSFVAQLSQMSASGQSPNVLLLTVPWRAARPKMDPFHLVSSDHTLAEQIFPFRYLIRDAFSFLMTARRHGGIKTFYEESKHNAEQMLSDGGYYFISEQSHFPNEALPADFRLPSDASKTVYRRVADLTSPELSALNQVLTRHRIQCYFVPSYYRVGEFAVPPQINVTFAKQVESASSCRVLGPDYFLLPNSYFSDQNHLNHIGATAYTKALQHLVFPELSKVRSD